MRILTSVCLCVSLCLVAIGRPTAQATTGTIIDHTSLPLFTQIPSSYETAARGKRLIMADRSVGGNIQTGLQCLALPYDATNNSCAGMPTTGVTAETWSHVYPSPNWEQWWEPTQGPTAWQMASPKFNGLWTGMQPGWMQWVAPKAANYDVISFQYNYLFALWGNLPDYFINTPATDYDFADFVAFGAAIAPTKVIYWTTSVPKSDGGTPGVLQRLASFNALMRQRVPAGGVLIDFADLVTHRPDGSLCQTGGVPRMCDDYTSEPAGGHLSTGWARVRAAKLVWIAMAVVSGWTPGGVPDTDTTAPTLDLTCAATSCQWGATDNVGVVSVTISVTARDAAGNQTTRTSVQ